MNEQNETNWKNQIYLMGTLSGAIFGLIARAAEEEAERNDGKPSKIKTGQLITLGLSGLGLIRQISEMGKPDKK